ncbi:MAG: hypothetical protein AAF447_12280, partial [Myxococcota bacterium]
MRRRRGHGLAIAGCRSGGLPAGPASATGPVRAGYLGFGDGLAFAAGLVLGAGMLVGGCAKTGLDPGVDADVLDRRVPEEERCNGLDDDLDGSVDEVFRDADGRYVDPFHCGGCGLPCVANDPALAVTCALVDEAPVCVATRCAAGFALSRTGRCVPAFERHCLPCTDDASCGAGDGAPSADVGGERRCVAGCGPGCPAGYVCTGDACVPAGGSCSCEPGEAFDVACAGESPAGELCPGRARCDDGTLSACVLPEEACNGADDDCDGSVDETFRDGRGAYAVDPRHCGRCGVDCTAEALPEGDLVCGGDPFAPSCVLRCPDAEDGLDPGDRVDADGDIATGCECTLISLSDAPGPRGAEGEDLDTNCDGAEGVVVESFYVRTGGDDRGPGSPTRPLRSLQRAVDLAEASLTTDAPRPDVYVASGVYTESLRLPSGVRVHGGYRQDFRALDPEGFAVELRAPADTDAAGGAALVVAEDEGRASLLEGLSLRGRDARGPSEATFGAVLEGPAPGLTLRDVRIRAGVPGAGQSGASGDAGAGPTREATPGELPRASDENAANLCVDGPSNRAEGGAGGVNLCAGLDVSGGAGGASSCPNGGETQPTTPGSFGEGPGGGGGSGGEDILGPIRFNGRSCTEPVACCGLADFSVSEPFFQAEPGDRGR